MARHLSILCVNTIAQEGVHGLRLFRRGRAPRSDGPYRFISEDGPGKAADSVHRGHGIELAADDGLSLLRFTLIQGFPDAQDRREAGSQNRRKFAGHQGIILVIPAAPLGMPDDDITAAHILEHGCGYLAGERTARLRAHILRTNGNAAPAAGDTASPHLTGQAIDIAKSSLSLTEIAWMRTYLQPLIDQGKIDVEEEFQQSCFHISVYRNYLPPTPAHVTVAAARQPLAAPTF